MNALFSYINLGTEKQTNHTKIDTIRFFNLLALVGVLIHMSYFILLRFIDLADYSLINLGFACWFAAIPLLNYTNKPKTARHIGNLAFAPMVIFLAFAYGGGQHIEGFLMIGLALSFFSFSKTKPLIFYSFINLSAYFFVVVYRHFNLFPEPSTKLEEFETTLLLTDVLCLITAFTVILFVTNRHYRRKHEELKKTTKELKMRTYESDQLLREANNANSSKLKLLRVISHDLRAPFTGLLGLTELMEQQYDRYDKEEMKEMLRMLSDSSKNTLMLIENLVQWSKLHANNITVERRNLRLNSIIKQIIKIYENMARQKKINILNETDDFLMVNADENMLMLIVRNLINNALKYTCEGGEIHIQAVPKRRYVRISVADNGKGMSPEQINSVLLDNEHHSEAGTMGEKGSGLGLLLCREFAEAHNCRMYIDSIEGNGTTVTFTMPAAKPE